MGVGVYVFCFLLLILFAAGGLVFVNEKSSRNLVQGPFVEFFNPKMRRELEKKDEEIKRTTGLKGSAPGGDDWAYLTSFSRVPVSNTIRNIIPTTKFIKKYSI